ncbi:hypothetical protein [Peribacillus sp. JNUCC41]|nr:hypothetical protein [Brevibacillus sp. JNUCC-41]
MRLYNNPILVTLASLVQASSKYNLLGSALIDKNLSLKIIFSQ